MPEKHETLTEFVTRILSEKSLSFRDVAEKSGGAISHSTVADIANGQRVESKKGTLTALAKGLDEPSDVVFRVARGLPAEEVGLFEIYAERFDAHDLSETEWQFLETYFKDQVELFKRAKEERKRAVK